MTQLVPVTIAAIMTAILVNAGSAPATSRARFAESDHYHTIVASTQRALIVGHANGRGDGATPGGKGGSENGRGNGMGNSIAAGSSASSRSPRDHSPRRPAPRRIRCPGQVRVPNRNHASKGCRQGPRRG